jgi:hypothetical protein
MVIADSGTSVEAAIAEGIGADETPDADSCQDAVLGVDEATAELDAGRLACVVPSACVELHS